MIKQTTNVQKAEKLVTKATTVFGDAVTQVEKANELLKEEIANDSTRIKDYENQIVDIRKQIDLVEEDRSEKSLKVISNEGLLQQLKTFVPQS